MDQIEEQDPLNLIKELTTYKACKAYLTKIKMQDGFRCVKCVYTKGFEKGDLSTNYQIDLFETAKIK